MSTTFLLIHSSVDGHLSCFPLWPLCIMLLGTWVYKYLSESLLSVLLDINSEVKFLDYTEMLFLASWGTTTLFHIAAAALHIATNPF